MTTNDGYMVKVTTEIFASFLNDPAVTEIMVNKPGQLFTKGLKGDQEHLVPELTFEKLEIMSRTISVFNKTKEGILNYFTLPDGERCTIIRPPAAYQGLYGFIIRKFLPVSLTLEEIRSQGGFDLIKNTSFHKLNETEIDSYLVNNDGLRISEDEATLLRYLHNKEYEKFFECAVQSHKNIVISGATNSGKTTFMRAILEYIDKSERIITIQDVEELKLDNFPNKLHLIFGRGEGQMRSQQLLEACMRATPDRILLAELRGIETWDYLQSLNTGHPGSITSVHASSAYRAFMRISTLANQSEEGRAIGFSAIKETVFNTIDIVIQIKNRKLTEIFYDPVFQLKKLNQN